MQNKVIKTAVLLLIMLALSPVYGQLVVSLTFNRTRYMLHEHIYACVTIRNDSGRPLLFGNRPELQGFVLFDVRDEENRLIKKVSGAEVSVTGLYLGPGEVKRMVIPLHKYYNFAIEGVYHIYAYVSHNQIEKEYRSKSFSIRVSPGAVVWERSVGLPDHSGKDNSVVVERRYSVAKLDDGGTRSFYLRVEDNGKVYAVVRIGHEVAHMKFDAQVDMLSRIHLLMPIAPRVYHYMSFNTDGMNLDNSYWKTSGTIPQLYRDDQSGKVLRIGGVEAKEGVDYANPREGYLTVSDLLEEETVVPDAKRYGGLVDLGAGLLPEQSADEN